MTSRSHIFSKYLGDTETVNLFSDEMLISKICLFEIALAKEQARLHIIPEAAAKEIDLVLRGIKINPTDLADETRQDGIPVIALLQIMRSALAPATAKFLHYGTTSQDAMDTALVLMLKDSAASIRERVGRLISNLNKLSDKYGGTPCMARTRGQLAIPTLFKHKLRAWVDPLERQQRRLTDVIRDVLKIQLGGAVGDGSVYKEQADQLMKAVSVALELHPALSWHTQRDSLCELTNWMAITSGILGKMGADILVMTQSEIGELIENSDGGGKSSSMSHKNNPVLSEALVALAKLNAGLQSTQLMSLVHSNERDATAWILDWACIPNMVINTAAGLNHAITISEKMTVDTQRMKENVDRFNSTIRKT